MSDLTAKTHFDEIYRSAEIELLSRRMKLFHGYQGERPVLTDDRPLWCTRKEQEAKEYCNFGNRSGVGGVLMLRFKQDEVALIGEPNGLGYLEKKGEGGHAVYARDLQSWGAEKRVRAIRESQDVYILLRPASQVSVVGIDEL